MPQKSARIEALAAAGLPLGAALAELVRTQAPRHTLLAVCPNSHAVARAALQAAQEADAPLLFAATLNQVDTDGGYTGWTPAGLAGFVAKAAAKLALDVPVLLCLDHGGPWKKDQHVRADLPFETTWAAVKTSLAACLDAGYALLHLDPTVDRRLPTGTPIPLPDIVERTLELLAFAEAHRQRRGLAPVAYEVGTEEVGGGLESAQRFAAFLEALDAARRARGLPRPTFVVGNVGTTLDTPHFHPARARQLAALARPYGLLVKGHYTDGVANPEAYPISGVGGANVGPGFAAVEYDALMALVRLERQLDRNAGFPEALQAAVVASGRWEKWWRPEEEGLAFDALPPARQQWLLETGSRYVWTDPEVEAARARLYAHVAPYRDADAYVLWRLKEAMMRYFHAFNLVGFNDHLLAGLPALGGADDA